MSRSPAQPPARRSAQAAAVAALGVPVILLAHLATTGRAASPVAALAVVGAVLAVAGLVRAASAARLALVTVLGQVAGHSVLALAAASGASSTGCIPAVGRGASLGLHLALLRPDETCPAGTLAPGPTSAALAGILTAAVILVGHAIAAVLTGIVLAAARHAVRAVRDLAVAVVALPARVRWLLLAARPVPPAGRAAPVRTPPTRIERTSQWRPGAVLLRGPPRWLRRAVPGVA